MREAALRYATIQCLVVGCNILYSLVTPACNNTNLASGARADIKQRDAVTNETPLHCAVVFGHVQVAKILIEARAELNAQDLAGGLSLYPLNTRPQ